MARGRHNDPPCGRRLPCATPSAASGLQGPPRQHHRKASSFLERTSRRKLSLNPRKENLASCASNASNPCFGQTRVEGDARFSLQIGKSKEPTALAGSPPGRGLRRGREARSLTATALLPGPVAREGRPKAGRGAAGSLPDPRARSWRRPTPAFDVPAARPRATPPADLSGRAGPRAFTPAGRRALRRAGPRQRLNYVLCCLAGPPRLAGGADTGNAGHAARGASGRRHPALSFPLPVCPQVIPMGRGSCIIATHPLPPESGG